MHVRPHLEVRHPWIAAAQQRVRREERRKGHAPPGALEEAREALHHARVAAVAELVAGDFTREQLEELVALLEAALGEFGN
ncbi:hypothetical protein [Nocardiopsis sp. NPDC055824]